MSGTSRGGGLGAFLLAQPALPAQGDAEVVRWYRDFMKQCAANSMTPPQEADAELIKDLFDLFRQKGDVLESHWKWMKHVLLEEVKEEKKKTKRPKNESVPTPYAVLGFLLSYLTADMMPTYDDLMSSFGSAFKLVPALPNLMEKWRVRTDIMSTCCSVFLLRFSVTFSHQVWRKSLF